MKLLHFPPEIRLPEGIDADDPLHLFTMYFTPEIIQTIVDKTNQYERAPQDEMRPFARALQWYDTTVSELYIYFAIRIYMTYNIQNEISDYWSDKKFIAYHDITQYMARDRFQELHIRVRIAGNKVSGPYKRVDTLSDHAQDMNLSVYVPGRDLAIDECMIRYEGNAKEATTVPNKPTPTGFKHMPGAGNSPVDTKTPPELGSSKRSGKGGNKTQAVVLKLLRRLPLPLTGYGYHCFLDNLFISVKFVSFARSQGFGVTGTCRTNSGIVKELLELKKSDKNDVIPWGQLWSYPTIDGAIDEADHLIAQNSGLREVRRGGHQAIEHWIFRLILVNCYLLAKRAKVEELRKLRFRSQQEFRRLLVEGLISKAKETIVRSPKKRVAVVS
ncbi:uncharacterized protein RSE6_01854 [Rhynchosporium secalis]|uniref:PiggyBac transposable element-derived protein domain-containing protein n=1 Tax=Rhynchosporium secalis TaxID=38038 RepID=A0A1E1LYU6_RHYSE|nr:uncharacterized protein RSE6_01854 [Rhynchosporium secalis]